MGRRSRAQCMLDELYEEIEPIYGEKLLTVHHPEEPRFRAEFVKNLVLWVEADGENEKGTKELQWSIFRRNKLLGYGTSLENMHNTLERLLK